MSIIIFFSFPHPLWFFKKSQNEILKNILLNTIIIIIHSLEFFISALADGFSLGSEWQQVSSSLPDSSRYSDRSQ